MGRITEYLVRKRAEHNEGMVSTLEEVALHQQNIEKIELLGHLCPRLKILYLQNNLIGKIQNLHKLKDLEYLNLAVNNITKVQNLQRCESLRKLDLTINFIPLAGLMTVDSLAANVHLEELYLLGNPCTDWPGFRQYVIAKLPRLHKLDGQEVKHSERILAQQALPDLIQQLHAQLHAQGIDPMQAAQVEDDSLYEEGAEVPETGWVDDKGELRRPWCPATRLLDHREMERQNAEAEAKKRSSQVDPLAQHQAPRHTSFPPAPDAERFFQKNEGKWEFSLVESDDSHHILLDVEVGRYLDSSLIQTDLQPTYVRLLIKGRLLQLQLPCEVCPDAATAQRSKVTGNLIITMPKADGCGALNPACIRPSRRRAPPVIPVCSNMANKTCTARTTHKALIQEAIADADVDDLPAL